MVEVSPVLRRMQWEALRCQGPPPPVEDAPAAAASSGSDHQQRQQDASGSGGSSEPAGSRGASGTDTGSSSSGGNGSQPASCSTSGWNGAAVSWHRSLNEVQPEGPAIYIAHEFFDALPVHQFQRTGRELRKQRLAVTKRVSACMSTLRSPGRWWEKHAWCMRSKAASCDV